MSSEQPIDLAALRADEELIKRMADEMAAAQRLALINQMKEGNR